MKRGYGIDGSGRSGQQQDRPAIVILALTLCCVGLFAHGFDSPLGQALSCMIGSGTLLALLLLFPPWVSFWPQVRWPLILFITGLVWLAIVGTVRSVMPVDTSGLPYAPDLFLPKFLSVVAGFWFLLIGAIIGQHRAERRVAINWIILLITAFAVCGLAMLLLESQDMALIGPMVQRGRFLGLTGNANVTASICGAGAVLCVSAGLSEWLAWWRGRDTPQMLALSRGGMALVGAFLLNFASLLYTASRVAVLMTVLSLVLLFVHHAYVGRRSFRAIAQGAAAVGGIILIAILLFPNVLIERASVIGPDALARWTFWAHLIDIAGSVTWTGLGPGAFPQANIYFLQNSTSSLRETWIINSPHSVLLQLWFAGGLPYLLSMTGGAVLILRSIVVRIDLRHCSSRHVGVVLASLVIIAVGLIDIPLDVTASADLTFVLVGLAWTAAMDDRILMLPGRSS